MTVERRDKARYGSTIPGLPLNTPTDPTPLKHPAGLDCMINLYLYLYGVYIPPPYTRPAAEYY